MANMNMPPVDIPPLRSTLTKWAVRSGVLLVIVVVWAVWLDGPAWLWGAWAAFAAGTLGLALILRKVLGRAQAGAAGKNDDR